MNALRCNVKYHYHRRLISNTSPPHHRHKVCNKIKEAKVTFIFHVFLHLCKLQLSHTTTATITILITLHIANQSQYFIRNDILFASLVKRWIVLQQQRIIRKWIGTQRKKTGFSYLMLYFFSVNRINYTEKSCKQKHLPLTMLCHPSCLLAKSKQEISHVCLL